MENNFRRSNAGQSMSIAALVLGIVSIIFAFIPCINVLAVIGGVLAIIFSAIGMSQAKSNNASTTLSKVSFVIGIIALLLAVAFSLFYGFILGLLMMWD
ncbi:hypothetical protein IW20_13915 [Flavobacterium hydatis]|jgi:membrane-anchored glycerophosphoryl diester phosphodiesterase (GDPDase)|uniref:DUF4190 domain-containing protein n=2 Tax=Flavobacterium hydatis TaxID=991 RepID=A0A086AFW1_FLAHY|nr:hypothetical protein IW20_13915 [Flavobacterium hydatis]